MNTLEITQKFLGHVFAGEMDKALDLVADDAVFISTNPLDNAQNPMHGTFKGKAGAQKFFGGFGEVLEPGEFEVTAGFGQDDHAAMYGTLRHTVRSTGKPFPSDWALIAKSDAGKLTLYHFYEDSEALAKAMTA